jgi:hypothetical protein
MTELVAFLSTGKGTWGHVNRLLGGINGEKWERIILLTNEFGMQNFKPQEGQEGIELVQLNTRQDVTELTKEIVTKLKEKVKGSEVGVNFVSGDGKDHMALMSALMKSGIGFRLISLDKDSNVIEV